MEIGERGEVTFSPEETDAVRAALLTIEHYATNVWDQIEVSAICGFTAGKFASLRQQLDSIRGA
ncbi:hypothetical protein ACFTSF_26490 [Kribbella sp. NPDC056951]|uniref:hypothetical protein n=1 Tax=Kribbella sp. NPDC056951 TaxID=3345978 RepID=UPI00363A9BFC